MREIDNKSDSVIHLHIQFFKLNTLKLNKPIQKSKIKSRL